MDIGISCYNLKLNLSKWLKDYWTLHIAVIIYVIVFGIAVLVRHYSFESSAWDLGIFSQACYSTLNGKLFYYTAELYANPGGSLFGAHFSPILFAILPFYAPSPTPETLLLTQTVGLAFGAYPVFFLAKEILSRKLAFYFSLFYLLNPLLHSINIFDFHPDAFFVPLALLSLYFFVKERWGLYLMFMVFSFFTKEFMSLGFLMFAVGGLLSVRGDVLMFLKERKLCSKKILVLILTIVMVSLWFGIAKFLIWFFNPNPPSGFIEGSPWKVLGANPLNPLTWGNVLELNFLGAIKFDLQSKLFYLIIILAPLAFLPTFKLSRLPPVLMWLLLAFLSNYPPYYGLGTHYPALFIPFLMTATIEGFEKLSSTSVFKKNILPRTAKKLLLVGALSSLTFTFTFLPVTDIRFYVITNHDRRVHEVLSWIRQAHPNASILTQYDVFPHISNMMDSYIIPPPFTSFKREYYYEYANSLFDKEIDYIIIDLTPDVRTYAHYMTHMFTFKNIYVKGNYGLYASIDGVLIYKSGYEGDLTVFEPFTIHNSYDAEIGRDTTLFGHFLPPGTYNVTYHMTISPKIDDRVFTIEIDQNRSVLATMEVFGTEFVEEKVYKNFTLPLIISHPNEEVEFLITNPSISTGIKIDWLEISIINHSR